MSTHPINLTKVGFIAKETPTKVLVKYADFTDIFSLNLASKLLEHTGINDHAIKLVNANRFIRQSKSPIGALRQAEKALIFPKDLLLADTSMVFYFQ